MKLLFTLLLFFAGSLLQGQDTLRIMQYNLLMYGNNFGGCTSSNNNIDNKNAYLHTIVNYVKPDILTVNEIYKTPYYHQYLLANALNIGGVGYFQMGNPPNYSGSPTVNQIFYNSEKLTMQSNVAIETSVRDIDIFKLKYNNSQSNIFLNCAVAHLKAGNESSDESERASETNKLMTYLSNGNATGNYLMMGDFNVYTASEQAFQNLLFYQNVSVRFYDPVNKIGSWNGNSYYASVQTQSTHTSGGCPSGGGLDDRFDFILASDEVINGTDKMKYLNGSYHAVGQDGEHFNKSLLASPSNTTVPSDVLNALYEMSDHLPVVIELLVGDNLGTENYQDKSFNVSLTNPVHELIDLMFSTSEPGIFTYDILNLEGQNQYSGKFSVQNQTSIKIPVGQLKPAIYLLRITDKNGNSTIKKITKL